MCFKDSELHWFLLLDRTFLSSLLLFILFSHAQHICTMAEQQSTTPPLWILNSLPLGASNTMHLLQILESVSIAIRTTPCTETHACLMRFPNLKSIPEVDQPTEVLPLHFSQLAPTLFLIVSQAKTVDITLQSSFLPQSIGCVALTFGNREHAVTS